MARDHSQFFVLGHPLSLKRFEVRFPHEGLVPLAAAAGRVRVGVSLHEPSSFTGRAAPIHLLQSAVRERR